MDITRENYEIWAIDYLEGKLSTSESALFMAFLGENSDLADELDIMRDTKAIQNLHGSDFDFQHLKKKYSSISITPDCFEEFCIAYHEADLDIQSRKNLFAYIAVNLNRKQQFETYKLLKVKPNKLIEFKNKKALKKPTGKPVYLHSKNIWRLTGSVAAIFIIFIALTFNGLYNFNSINTSIKTSQLSEIDKKYNSIYTLSIASKLYVNKDSIEITNRKIIQKKHAQIHLNRALSAIDTSDLEYPLIPAMRIETNTIPTTIKNSDLKISTISNKKYYSEEANLSFPRKTINIVRRKSQSIFKKPGKLSLDAMLRRSVDGINHVAETDLHYNSELDNDGKIIAFAFSSERFNITRKIKNN